jgi:hypothetical protein
MYSRTHLLVIACVAWLMMVGAGLAALWQYASMPGSSEAVAEEWPAESRVSHDPRLPTLVMFAHPKCPCSRASVGELARLMVHVQGRVAAELVFYRPAGVESGWERTDLWKAAALIPGVRLRTDDDGVEAHRFGALTSGHTFLYDFRGRLLFSGGITAARGHAGDNPGSTAIAALVNGRIATSRTRTFGCFLRDAGAL